MSDQNPQPQADWPQLVQSAINNSPLSEAGWELARLVAFALKTQHDEQFARDVDACIKSFWARCEREKQRVAFASVLAANAARLGLRSITWTDEDSNADRYYRGFNDGVEFAAEQHNGKVPAAIVEAIDTLCRVNEYHSAARLLRAWLVPHESASVADVPTVVCLCGSTRFYEAFVEANFRETMAGKIVLSVGFFLHRPEMVQIHGETVGISPEEKVMLDELHLRKIDQADEVLILNVGGYIGESTRRELAYAQAQGKTVRFLEPML